MSMKWMVVNTTIVLYNTARIDPDYLKRFSNFAGQVFVTGSQPLFAKAAW